MSNIEDIPFRNKLSWILESNAEAGKASLWYGRVMTVLILASLLPLCFRNSTPVLEILETAVVTIFIIDYLSRWATADYKLGKGWKSFFIYPFTPMAIIDLLSILPAFAVINPAFKLTRLFRLARASRAFRLLRFSKSFAIISGVFKSQKRPLLAVLGMVIGYIFIAALVMFNVEPDTFKSLFDALYWSVISLTTVGYGDIYPTTEIGKAVAMISSLMGVAVIALPSAIITAGYMNELNGNETEE